MSETGNDHSEALRELERFVVENDELLALEERIGRFNIFDALGIARVEIRHSNFLAWLLDPAESHGQGALFLGAILMDLMKQAREAGIAVPVSPVELDGADMGGVEIRREWRSIDLLIHGERPGARGFGGSGGFVIAIENKVDSGEHSDQLDRYRRTVAQEFKDVPALYVFLTREGDEASDEDWCPYSYRHIHRVLSRVRKTHENAIGADVRTFLDHYLNLIGSRFMDDPEIDDLCRRIYQNHRQALDLIFENIGFGPARFVQTIEELITNDSRFRCLGRGSQRIRFVPVGWLNLLPPIGRESQVGPTNWLQLVLRLTDKSCSLACVVRPTSDSTLRSMIIQRLTNDPSEFGLKSFFNNREHIGSHYATLGRETVYTWNADEEPEEEKLISAIKKKLDQWHGRLAGVPDSLRPIIEQWERDGGRARASGAV
ncbi:MAG: PD-(D/E)XK nuclease family protein [Phycisphaeraceae bacterium]